MNKENLLNFIGNLSQEKTEIMISELSRNICIKKIRNDVVCKCDNCKDKNCSNCSKYCSNCWNKYL